VNVRGRTLDLQRPALNLQRALGLQRQAAALQLHTVHVQ